MSALAIDEVFGSAPAVAAGPMSGGHGRLALVPAAAQAGAARPRAAARPEGLQLTERGIAVIVLGFLSLCMVAAVVVVAAFLAVPNEPLDGSRSAVAGLAQG